MDLDRPGETGLCCAEAPVNNVQSDIDENATPHTDRVNGGTNADSASGNARLLRLRRRVWSAARTGRTRDAAGAVVGAPTDTVRACRRTATG